MGFGKLLFSLAASVGIFFLVDLCSAEKAPYSFVKEATLAPPEAYYDYIVVGGGPAGCALAATLATASVQVLLLERGGLPYDNPNVTNMTGFPLLFMDRSPNSPLQPFISTDGVYNRRPRILGGGSAVNGGFFSYASAKYVERMGWDPLLVKESYKWVEKKIVFKPQVRQWQAAVHDGLLEAGVLPDRGYTYEHLQGTKFGGTLFDQNGYRHTAADLLEYADPKRITTYLHSIVQKILISNNVSSSGEKLKAYGVVFKDNMGYDHVAYLNNGPKSEIILSAGAIGSPQMLMLSGIGPAQQLLAQGIDVIMDQPLVGQGMSDNPMNGVTIPSRRPVEFSLIQTVGIKDTGNFIEATSGYMVSAPSGMSRNYEELVNQTDSPSSILTNQTMPIDPYVQSGSIFGKISGPFSTGYLELQSTDPNENPKVTFNYFQDPRDLERCVLGMKIVKRVVESKSLSSFLYPSTSFQSLVNSTLGMPMNLRKKHADAAFSLEQFCNDTVTTLWHYHGGCQIDRVVSRDYKVIGVDALRVVDGSTFDASPGTNPQATVMMLGRYVGQKNSA